MELKKYVYYNDVLMSLNVRNSFLALRESMISTLGVGLDVVDSIKQEADIVNELLARYKYKNELPRQQATQGAQDDEFIVSEETARVDNNYYQELYSFLLNSPITKFEPVIGPSKQSNRSDSELLYSIPNYPTLDPRRTGRIIVLGPRIAINNSVIEFMVRNAGKYGFLHYGPKDPTIWYWRGDKAPNTYTPEQVTSILNSELSYLL